MVTPVNCTTPAKSESKAIASSGKIGPIAKGANPWTKVTNVEHVMAESFHDGLQFYT